MSKWLLCQSGYQASNPTIRQNISQRISGQVLERRAWQNNKDKAILTELRRRI
ncbi:hypothetical protein AADH33_11760 [Psychrobacter sp. KFRI-CH2-11]|uniref:hypothetical protein n=1 Tax=Psychrobacter sp. KFRI-CH2-11 TaxID=3156079 RepID=UPI0032524AAC